MAVSHLEILTATGKGGMNEGLTVRQTDDNMRATIFLFEKNHLNLETRVVFEESQLPHVFALLTRIARAVVATVGPLCEVVVHDLRTPERTVIALSGNLTGRAIGAPVPEPSMLPERVDAYTDDILREQVQTAQGKPLVSSTVWVRDTTGHIVAALCINMDLGDIQHARDLLEQAFFATSPSPMREGFETIATSPEEFVKIALRSALSTIGKPIHRLTRQDKLQLMQTLDQAGVFQFRQTVDLLMQELGMSRASIYVYLKGVRQDTAVHAEQQEDKSS